MIIYYEPMCIVDKVDSPRVSSHLALNDRDIWDSDLASFQKSIDRLRAQRSQVRIHVYIHGQ